MIDHVRDRVSEASIRRSCVILGVRRATYHTRKRGHRPEEVDAVIAGKLRAITSKQEVWGFKKCYHILRNEGHKWNKKKVYRVYKAEGLNIRRIFKKPGLRREYRDLLAPDRINEGWAMDFVSDHLVGPEGRKVRVINIMDECSRKALWTTAHNNIPASRLIDVLDRVIEWRGVPSYIRCDNGPEFISEDLKKWAGSNGITLYFIQPGKPAQNGLIERLNGILRKECLDREWCGDIEELNERIQDWWWTYNTYRPHESIGNICPDAYEKKNEDFYFKVVAA